MPFSLIHSMKNPFNKLIKIFRTKAELFSCVWADRNPGFHKQAVLSKENAKEGY